MNNYRALKEFINSDLFRYTGKLGFRPFVKSYFAIPGFRYSFWLRITNYSKNKNKLLFLFSWQRLRHYSFKYGIQIPYSTNIGKGFYIGHYSCIVVSPEAIIGKNVNISQGVTIGKSSRGNNKGAAIISDDVYIGPGVKIIGKINIGRNVAIGANAVVTKDVPENAVVGGIPASIISMNGAQGYINNRI